VVIAAYSNERGPVLIDGSHRLIWLSRPPRNRKFISADEVRIDPTAVDEESAHRAAVALLVNRPQASSRVKAELARRLQGQFGWSQATIADVFKESRPAVQNWLRQLNGADVPEITGADGKIYPARGKQAPDPRVGVADPRAAGGTVSDALKVLYAEHEAVVQRFSPVRQLRIDRHGSADPEQWTVTIPDQSASAAARIAQQLRQQASELISLASKLEQTLPADSVELGDHLSR
jgi:hypothetical protein